MEWFTWACANLLPSDDVGWFYFWAFLGSLAGSVIARIRER